MKCQYCHRKATHRRTPDIDIKGVPLCGRTECFAELVIEIQGGIEL